MGSRILTVVVGTIFLTGCSSSLIGTSLDGMWGGDHIVIEISEASASVELDCAHGSLVMPVRTDKEGRFDVQGILVLESGGPIRDEEPEDSHPAVYTGRVTGDQMVLTINLTDVEWSELSFTLVRNEPGRLFKCL